MLLSFISFLLEIESEIHVQVFVFVIIKTYFHIHDRIFLYMRIYVGIVCSVDSIFNIIIKTMNEMVSRKTFSLKNVFNKWEKNKYFSEPIYVLF